jgi:hypothetical protein
VYRGRLLIIVGVLILSGCTGSRRVAEPAIDPDTAQAEITSRIPARVPNREGWAVDIFAAFAALRLSPTTQNVCAVIAVTEQESNFQANPVVPGLANIARREIDTRAATHEVPGLLVSAALALRSPNGKSYGERLEHATTEKELSDLFDDFIGMVPLGKRLFGDLNPVHTGGPMQVSVTFAEQQAAARRYPYPLTGTIRDEVFTRRGGVYFGVAHLLDYPATYDDMLFRLADFNAGHYASRNAAFQNALSAASGKPLALDGDVVRFGSAANAPSKTELAARDIAKKIGLSEAEIHTDLRLGQTDRFEQTTLYDRVFSLADKAKGRRLPRALVPRIQLDSPKIKRRLTTEWFAQHVNDRYLNCLARGAMKRSS